MAKSLPEDTIFEKRKKMAGTGAMKTVGRSGRDKVPDSPIGVYPVVGDHEYSGDRQYISEEGEYKTGRLNIKEDSRKEPKDYGVYRKGIGARAFKK